MIIYTLQGGGGAGNRNSIASMDTTDGSGNKNNHGGLGGGGAGGISNSSSSGTDALSNTGGGGGGGYYNGSTQGSGGNGGSGIVLIRYSYIRNIDGGSGGGTNKTEKSGLSYQLITNYNGYGNDGGKSNNLYSLGGGGGAGGIGLDGNTNDYGGNGGIGIDFSNIFSNIFGDDGWFAGGGGGSGLNYFGTGGKGGGGIAGSLTNLPTNGLDNTGSGGGGNRDYGKSGAGGSGTVIVRYKPYIEFCYKQIRTSENNYDIINLSTDNITNNIVNINFYNGKTNNGVLQTAKGLLLYPGNYRVSYYKGCQNGNNSDQATLYKCLSNFDGTWTMNHTCIPLTRGIGAQGDYDGTYGYNESIIVPDIPYFNFTLTEITAVFIQSTGTTGWINTFGQYNNEIELDNWNKYFKSQYNNRVFPNNSTSAYDTWIGLSSEHNIKIIKYGEVKPTISLSNFYILPTTYYKNS